MATESTGLPCQHCGKALDQLNVTRVGGGDVFVRINARFPTGKVVKSMRAILRMIKRMASAYAAGLTEREVIDLMYKARRDTMAIMQRSMLSMHSVSMYVCERCGSRATYTGPTVADILGRPGESRG